MMNKIMDKDSKYILELYIDGETFISKRAIKSIEKICKNELNNNVKLTIIDIKKNPEFLMKENIIAVPALVRLNPLPKRQIIGDLQDYQRILRGLDIG